MPSIISDIFVELASSEFFGTEGENLVWVLITKSGETEQSIDVVLSLSDGLAKGTAYVCMLVEDSAGRNAYLIRHVV